MVMADDWLFMAAVVYHNGLVLALLPSHLFLLASWFYRALIDHKIAEITANVATNKPETFNPFLEFEEEKSKNARRHMVIPDHGWLGGHGPPWATFV